MRVGLDYKLGNDITVDTFTKVPDALELDRFALHGQTTFVEQYVPPFHAPYHGQNSLDSNQGREAWGAMFFAGVKLWDGAELWIDPEIDQGFGPSNSVGVAGYPGGAAYKVGASVPYARIQRAFVRQTIDLGGDFRESPGRSNQFDGSNTADRLVLTIGKFAPTDMFDQNKYAHQSAQDFMNWALIDTGTFDYAADAWGYTYGAAAEWYQGDWTVRGGLFDLPIVPNSTDLDPSFGQFQWVGEVERRWELWSHPGKIAFTGYLTRARLGSYQDAVQLAQLVGGPADTVAVRQYRSRGGISMNAEQEITPDLGVFMRAGVANGDIEPDDLHRHRSHGRGRYRSSKARSGDAPTTHSAWPASSTASRPRMRPISMPAASASRSATACCRIPGSSRSSKPITSFRCSTGRRRSIISSSPIRPTTAIAVRFRLSLFASFRSFRSVDHSGSLEVS